MVSNLNNSRQASRNSAASHKLEYFAIFPSSASPHRLVVRTSRRGRDNPGSTPGEDISFCKAILALSPLPCRKCGDAKWCDFEFFVLGVGGEKELLSFQFLQNKHSPKQSQAKGYEGCPRRGHIRKFLPQMSCLMEWLPRIAGHDLVMCCSL